MLSLGYPKINFQVANNFAHDQMLEHIQELVTSATERGVIERPITPATNNKKEMAFQVSSNY